MAMSRGIERRGSLSGGRAGPPRFSASVLHNQLVYVAGQIASDASQDYADQARQVLHLVEECLTAAGTSKAQLLKVNVFLRNIDEGADSFNAVWDSWVDRNNLPVRTTIEAKLMRPDLLVEVDCIAAAQQA